MNKQAKKKYDTTTNSSSTLWYISSARDHPPLYGRHRSIFTAWGRHRFRLWQMSNARDCEPADREYDSIEKAAGGTLFIAWLASTRQCISFVTQPSKYTKNGSLACDVDLPTSHSNLTFLKTPNHTEPISKQSSPPQHCPRA